MSPYIYINGSENIISDHIELKFTEMNTLNVNNKRDISDISADINIIFKVEVHDNITKNVLMQNMNGISSNKYKLSLSNVITNEFQDNNCNIFNITQFNST